MTPLQKPVPDWLQRLRTKAWRKRVREWEQINLEWRKEMAERCNGSQVEWMGNMLRRAEQLPTEEQQPAIKGLRGHSPRKAAAGNH